MTTTIGLPFIDKKLIVELLLRIDTEILNSYQASKTEDPSVIRVTDEETGLQVVYSHEWDIRVYAMKRRIEITWEAPGP